MTQKTEVGQNKELQKLAKDVSCLLSNVEKEKIIARREIRRRVCETSKKTGLSYKKTAQYAAEKTKYAPRTILHIMQRALNEQNVPTTG